METQETHVTPCPYCGAPNDRVTVAVNNREDEKPEPKEGDLSLCWSCGSTLRYNDRGETEKLLQEHIDAYPEKMLAQLMALSITVKRKIVKKEFKEKHATDETR